MNKKLPLFKVAGMDEGKENLSTLMCYLGKQKMFQPADSKSTGQKDEGRKRGRRRERGTVLVPLNYKLFPTYSTKGDVME